MRILVCGGRDYGDRAAVFGALDRLHRARGIDAVIHGGARGADTLAGEWARMAGVPCEVYPADWTAHGRSAGPRRNALMLERGTPHGVVAFPGGVGTADMTGRAEAAGIRVWRPVG